MLKLLFNLKMNFQNENNGNVKKNCGSLTRLVQVAKRQKKKNPINSNQHRIIPHAQSYVLNLNENIFFSLFHSMCFLTVMLLAYPLFSEAVTDLAQIG